MSHTSHARAPVAAATRISSYLLTEYLERLGVEVIFGLCGHTVIGFLDALSKSKIRFVSTRPGAAFSPSGVLTLELPRGESVVALARATLAELVA